MPKVIKVARISKLKAQSPRNPMNPTNSVNSTSPIIQHPVPLKTGFPLRYNEYHVSRKKVSSHAQVSESCRRMYVAPSSPTTLK